MDTAPKPVDPKLVRQIRCHVCGKIAEYTQSELVEKLNKDWPECCGEVMVIVPYQLKKDTPKID